MIRSLRPLLGGLLVALAASPTLSAAPTPPEPKPKQVKAKVQRVAVIGVTGMT